MTSVTDVFAVYVAVTVALSSKQTHAICTKSFASLDESVEVGGTCFYAISGSMNLQEALDECAAQGTRLPVYIDQAKQIALEGAFSSGGFDQHWMGLRQQSSVWSWWDSLTGQTTLANPTRWDNSPSDDNAFSRSGGQWRSADQLDNHKVVCEDSGGTTTTVTPLSTTTVTTTSVTTPTTITTATTATTTTPTTTTTSVTTPTTITTATTATTTTPTTTTATTTSVTTPTTITTATTATTTTPTTTTATTTSVTTPTTITTSTTATTTTPTTTTATTTSVTTPTTITTATTATTTTPTTTTTTTTTTNGPSGCNRTNAASTNIISDYFSAVTLLPNVNEASRATSSSTYSCAAMCLSSSVCCSITFNSSSKLCRNFQTVTLGTDVICSAPEKCFLII